jgi:hypothetical protein
MNRRPTPDFTGTLGAEVLGGWIRAMDNRSLADRTAL